jgi:hypothetical protein
VLLIIVSTSFFPPIDKSFKIIADAPHRANGPASNCRITALKYRQKIDRSLIDDSTPLKEKTIA